MDRSLGDVSGGGGILCPADIEFPLTGVLSVGQINVAGWTYADVDQNVIANVRKDGGVLNSAHWDLQAGRDAPALNVALNRFCS